MYKDNLLKSLNVLSIAFTVLLVVIMVTIVKEWKSIGHTQVNSISVLGDSSVFVSPDIANITFTIDEVKPTSKEAQSVANEKMIKVKKALMDLKISDKDIQSTNYYISPKYVYDPENCSTVCTYSVSSIHKTKIEGYTASHSVSIKVRDMDMTGKVLSSLGDLAVNNISGPNFSIEYIDKAKAEARGKAIVEAKSKAKVLADQLGVSLGDVISFSENSNGGYLYDMAKSNSMGATADSAPSAPIELSAGQSEIKSSVSIVYEIK